MTATADDEDPVRLALSMFLDTIEATGGVVGVGGYLGTETAPVADEEWVDLGEAYLAGCEALGREPMWVGEADPEEDDDGH